MIKFKTKRIFSTRTLAERAETDQNGFGKFIHDCLKRHFEGDWGDLDEEDKKANDEAIEKNERILSSYFYYPTGDKVYIITEADRVATTILYANEY